MFPELPKKVVDWAIVLSTVIGLLSLVTGLLPLFIISKQATNYIPRFLHQGIPVWALIAIVALLTFCYFSYKRLTKKPSIPSQPDALLPTGKVVQYGSKVALLTFDYKFAQVDMPDLEKRLKAIDRDKADKWEEFFLNDPNNDTSTRQLKYGDEIVLVGTDHKFMAADLNNNGTKFVYANRTEYAKNNWGKFTVEPLSTKTKLRVGNDVLYGHPVALKATNGDYLAFRQNQPDQLLWVAAKEVGTWEQFTFVTLP